METSLRLCVFEDAGVDLLEPLTLTRPAFDLWCGASTLLAKQRHWAGTGEAGALVRPHLADLTRLQHADLAVNDVDWLGRGPTLFVNSRWLPMGEADIPVCVKQGALECSPYDDVAGAAHVGLVGDQVAYVVGSPGPEAFPAKLGDWLESCKKSLPQVQAGGTLVDYLWDLVDHNAAALAGDFAWFQQTRDLTRSTPNLAILGPTENVAVARAATIEPFVVADARLGPVLIDDGAVIQSFSRLEGPCYIGRESWMVGGKLRGGSIGPQCRIGGEVEASIVQGYSNKYHDGFLGHSYVGSWVNLGAGTQTSDLRNDYGKIRVQVAGRRVSSGKTKVGSYIGDHTKTGLGALLNTGSVVGAFCNILPSGALPPTAIPSFCQYQNGQIQERWDMRQLLQTAVIVMRRRDCDMTDIHKTFFYSLYDHTADQRRTGLQKNKAS